MKKISVIFLTVFSQLLTYGQTDQEAILILDKFSSAALSAPSVSMDFRLITVNEAEKNSDTTAGSVVMSKNMYRLELPGNITWFNGSVSWNYLIPEKEVTITKPDRKDNSFMSKPSSVFTLYKSGYKIRLLGEDNNMYTIDLYPEDINSELVRIRMYIRKNTSALTGAEYRRKDGVSIYLAVDRYDLEINHDQAFFTFNPKEHKGVEVIDMR